MRQRYTAKLRFKKNNSIQSYANDLSKLIEHLLILLECHNGYVSGTIKDNRTGQIVHQCRKYYN